MIKTILIDDERMALEELKYLLQEFLEVKVIGDYTDPLKAIKELDFKNPDLVMLDIEMPEVNGFEVAEEILEIFPDLCIVFVTAYDEYAIKAFETKAIDYVLKPVSKERLGKTIDRACRMNSLNKVDAKDNIRNLNKYFPGNKYKVFAWENEDIVLLKPDDILYFKAEEKDINIVTNNKVYRTKYTLNFWENKLEDGGFFRCHKGFIINLDKVERMTPMFNNTYILKLSDTSVEIPVSRSAGKKLKSILGM